MSNTKALEKTAADIGRLKDNLARIFSTEYTPQERDIFIGLVNIANANVLRSILRTVTDATVKAEFEQFLETL